MVLPKAIYLGVLATDHVRCTKDLALDILLTIFLDFNMKKKIVRKQCWTCMFSIQKIFMEKFINEKTAISNCKICVTEKKTYLNKECYLSKTNSKAFLSLPFDKSP